MDKPSVRSRLQHAWNVLRNRDIAETRYDYGYGQSTGYRPDRTRLRMGNERSIVASIYNQIAMDVAAINIKHVRLDDDGQYESDILSGLNECLTTEANIDQTGRNLVQDIVMSMFDEGVVAVVPVDTTFDPTISDSYDIKTLRVGRVVSWFPQHVRVAVYNDQKGIQQEVTVPKKMTALIENPLYATMNESNSVLKRLIRKLNILDAIDEQSGSGKLDLIIQLPYVLKTPQQREVAETRRKDIEVQLAGSKYGIAYTDGTERVTQLNRPADNNLLTQIQYLTGMLWNQLGMSEAIFNGTASEAESLNYFNRTVSPILCAIVEEMKRKFLTKTARSQRQSIEFFRDPFKLMPMEKVAEIADKFTRNEIMSPNEIRAKIGLRPSKDPQADELRNRNLNQNKNSQSVEEIEVTKGEAA